MTRRSNSATEPRLTAGQYAKALDKLIDAIQRETERLIYPILDEVAFRPARQDAKVAGFVSDRLTALELRIAELYEDRDFIDGIEAIGVKVQSRNKRLLKRVVGISLESADPEVFEMVGAFRSQNVSLIRNMTNDLLRDLQSTLEGALANGLTTQSLTKEIEKRFDVTKSRAKLIARDQTQKLNGQIARSRMQAAGVEEYIWTTSSDERVRGEHADRDGQRFRWDTPPPDGHPGEAIQCRCTAFPVIPEFA